ncbi:MAG: NAD-dependent epimerase/dehydratase family protein [Syntrophaceae bacterium]|nr:NAD-dependent epimerase/dehydratase family protein [Syntrophaceae bacterium]
MKILVTGGGGFLGSYVARQLLERGDNVRSFSRGSYDMLKKLGIEQKQGSLDDFNAVADAVSGCDAVIHVGSKAGAWGPYDEYYSANVVGTENVIKACQQHGVDKLVYTSSPSVVFSGGDIEGADESLPYSDHYLSNYPKTKAMAEKMVIAANGDKLATVSLRPHLIWGPGDNHLIPRLISRAKAGRLLFIGNAQNIIDITWVENAAKAHLLALDKLKPGANIAGKVYFITNGEPKKMEFIINMIMDIYELPHVRRHVPKRLAYAVGLFFEKIYDKLKLKGEPLVTPFVAEEMASTHWFDISGARNDLGYNPDITLENGAKIYKEYLRKGGS